MKIATQNQAFFPTDILEKFQYIKAMGFDGYEIDGKLLVDNLAEVKAAIKATGLPVTTACGGYDGWIGCEYRPAARTEAGLGWFVPYRASQTGAASPGFTRTEDQP